MCAVDLFGLFIGESSVARGARAYCGSCSRELRSLGRKQLFPDQDCHEMHDLYGAKGFGPGGLLMASAGWLVGRWLSGWRLLERLAFEGLVWLGMLRVVLDFASLRLVCWWLPARFPESTSAGPECRITSTAESIRIGNAPDLKVARPIWSCARIARIRGLPDSPESSSRPNHPN